MKQLMIVILLLVSSTLYSQTVTVEFSGGSLSGEDLAGNTFSNASYVLRYFVDSDKIASDTGFFKDVHYEWDIKGVGVFRSSDSDGLVKVGGNDPQSHYFIAAGSATISKGSQKPFTVDYTSKAFSFSPILLSETSEGSSNFTSNVEGGRLILTEVSAPKVVRAFETPAEVPEPSTLIFIALAMLGIFFTKHI